MKNIDEEIARRLTFLEKKLKNKPFYASLLLWGNKLKVSIKDRVTGAIQWIDTDKPDLTEKILEQEQ